MADIKDRAREYLAKNSEYNEVYGEFFVAVDTMTAMIEFAEQETKELKEQIERLSKHILELQKDKGELTDKVAELEAQVEKMKCCGNCIHCKYDENEESYEFCEKHLQVVNIAIVPCLEWKGR